MAQPIATNIDTGATASSETGINWTQLIPSILEKFVAVIEATLIIIGGIFLIHYLRKKLRKLETTHDQQRNAINLLEKITSGFIIVVSVTLALKIVGIDMTLLVSVGILGLSYGLQDIIKNYVAGILILFKAPFKIGDVVQIRGYTGRVSKMDFQSTSLETFDNRHITIYNSDVMTQSIVNFSNNSIRRLEVDVTMGYGSDTSRALKLFDKILKSNPKILPAPKATIVFKKFTEGGSTFTLKFWVQLPCNILKVKTEIATMVAQIFDDQTVYMPYTKDMQVESEAGLGAITDQRKQRLQAFYQLPLFAEMAPAQPQIQLTPEEAAAEEAGLSQSYADYEEPE